MDATYISQKQTLKAAAAILRPRRLDLSGLTHTTCKAAEVAGTLFVGIVFAPIIAVAWLAVGVHSRQFKPTCALVPISSLEMEDFDRF